MHLFLRQPREETTPDPEKVKFPTVVYRSDPHNFFSHFTQFFSAIEMTDDAVISAGEQTLRLIRITQPTDPLRFELRHSEDQHFQGFKFSVETATDAIYTEEDSGAYNMNVN